MPNTIPLISICIPAYKRLNYLKRLFASIENQAYKDFEVVITDDSGEDDEVEKFIADSNFNFTLRYIKNEQPLGSPRNWLECFKHAKGEWIKIMHDDDYFTHSGSLNLFVENIQHGIDCIFSGYKLVDDNEIIKDMTIKMSKFQKIIRIPMNLFASNIIGPPSVMLFKRGIEDQFDDRLKWIVDWEFYIRLASKYKLSYIPEPLISVGHNDTQITNSCFLNPEIEIPETLIFTNKYGNSLFKYALAYDAWWRLIRNLKFRNYSQILNYSKGLSINLNIKKMIHFQSFIPYHLLKIGFISKILMIISYSFNRIK